METMKQVSRFDEVKEGDYLLYLKVGGGEPKVFKLETTDLVNVLVETVQNYILETSKVEIKLSQYISPLSQKLVKEITIKEK